MSLLGSVALFSRRCTGPDTQLTEELRRRWSPSLPILFSVSLSSLPTSKMYLATIFPVGFRTLCGYTSQCDKCKLMEVGRWPPKRKMPEENARHADPDESFLWTSKGIKETWLPRIQWRGESQPQQLPPSYSTGRKWCCQQEANTLSQTPFSPGSRTSQQQDTFMRSAGCSEWASIIPQYTAPHPHTKNRLGRSKLVRHVFPFAWDKIIIFAYKMCMVCSN